MNNYCSQLEIHKKNVEAMARRSISLLGLEKLIEECKHYNSETKQETDFSLMIETITKSRRESLECPVKMESGSTELLKNE